jgi:hypothetical protein
MKTCACKLLVFALPVFFGASACSGEDSAETKRKGSGGTAGASAAGGVGGVGAAVGAVVAGGAGGTAAPEQRQAPVATLFQR